MRKWKEYIDPVGETLAYCLMPNHFHAMLEVKVGELLIGELVSRKKLEVIKHLRGLSEVESVSSLIMILKDDYLSGMIDLEGISKILTNFIIQQFSNFFNGYTKAINKRYQRYGSLFAPRFRRLEVTSDDYARRLIRYIHANPVHHGFCKDIGEWPYSSWAHYSERRIDWQHLKMAKYFEDYIQFKQWHHQGNIDNEQLERDVDTRD
jgi:REP element-mobilizing transposase RayT